MLEINYYLKKNPVGSHSESKGGHVEYSTVKWDNTLQLARQAMCI